MDPASALELTNVFPGAGAPTVRLGYEQFANLATASGGTASPIEFMHEYPLTDGTAQLIVAQNTQLFSISEAGTVSNISKVGGYADGNWNKELFAGNLYLANTSGDHPQVYQGNTATPAQNITGSGSGLTVTNLSNVSSYRERLYWTERNTLKMWYTETVRTTYVSGTPTFKSYDFQYIMRRGGYLLFTGTYTNQRNLSVQDLFMAVSSEGEVVLYSGTSPDDTAWTLVAHFIIGKPLGSRAFVRINQDVWIITQQGIVPVSALFELDPEQALNIVSLKINPLITQYASQVSLSNLWTGFFYPAGRRVYIVLPSTTATTTLLVYSLDTKSWTQFILYSQEHSLQACKFTNLPYYGSNTGIIYKGETGYADAVVSSVGQSITFAGRMAFSFYGSRGNYKAFKDIRPLLKGSPGLTLNLGLDTDFKRQATVTTVTQPPGTFTAWGSPWGSSWSSEVEYVYNRFAVAGQGHCAAVRFGGSIKNSPLQLLGFEVRFDIGGQV
jgi:hypothetical protein